jgi:metal-sulfur cluster biosynthetic enzyme
MPTEDDIRKLLRQVVDPEVGANIVDLGLIYRIDLSPELLHIDLTMTSPACPMSEMIVDEAREILEESLPKNCRVELCLVWEPPWRPDMMSERTRSNLGW